MLIPLWFISPFAGMPRFGLYWFWAVLSKAPPDGKLRCWASRRWLKKRVS
jgi:hypothetical protein